MRLLVMLGALACSAPDQRPAVGPTPPPRSTSYRVLVAPDVKLQMQFPHGVVHRLAHHVDLKKLEPGAQAPLATDAAVAKKLRAIVADRDRAVTQKRYEQRAAATKQLVDQLGKAASRLTLDGAKWRVHAAIELADDEIEAKLTALEQQASSGGPPPEVTTAILPDYTLARAAAAELAKRPDAGRDHEASFLAAFVEVLAARDDASELAASRAMLDVARKFPGSAVEESAYVYATQHVLGGRDDERVAIADAALGWLADRATTEELRADVRNRVGKRLLDRDKYEAARTRFCEVVQTTAPHLSMTREDAEYSLASSFDDQSVEPLYAACKARRCPCTAKVVTTLAEMRGHVEDRDEQRALYELSLSQFPLDPSGHWVSCALIQLDDGYSSTEDSEQRRTRDARYAPGSEWAKANPTTEVSKCEHYGPPPSPKGTIADQASQYASRQRALFRCLNDAFLRHERTQKVTTRFEISIGDDGIADDVVVASSTLDRKGTSCAAGILRRHRWVGFDRIRLILPITIQIDPVRDEHVAD